MSRRDFVTLTGAALAVTLGPGCTGSSQPSAQTSATATSAGSTSAPEASAPQASAPRTSAPRTSRAQLYFPPRSGAWEVQSPADAGWDAAALADAASFVRDRRSSGFIVVVGGRILLEEYGDGADAATTRDVASVQKSVTSALVGIAESDRLLSVEDAVSDSLGQGWSGADAAETEILIRHLLAMNSGLDEQLARVDDPEARWFYNTPAYAQLTSVLAVAAGLDPQTLSTQWLFDPIGMSDATWRSRERINTPASPQGLVMTPRDMARFGLLIAAGGSWAGTQVIPGPYLASSLSASQPLNPSYGWLWWLNGGATVQRPGSRGTAIPGPLIPPAPDDLVAALGAGDQKIYVVPSRDLVVVRQGRQAGRRPTDALSTFDAQLWDLIMKAAPPVG